jgi:trimeric autotransporter adhesin
MASTYSPLKIQLMTTGENLSTWGTVTNTNLGTALEEAIVGSADVTFSSGNVTLTLTNTNSTQTARNLRLNLVGTTGGSTRTLTVPDIEKIYLVNNTCADAVEVKNSTGSNVSVPAGKTMWVYSTGSNVVDAVTHLSSLSTSSLTATNVTATNIAATTINATTVNATNIISSGSDITNINASNITTGTLANARTTASSSNGSSTLVVRDASGNFSANTVTANLTGTASNATVLQSARTIALQDGVTGTATSFNGSANISIPVTAINASVINTGTIDNARTTAASSNGANTIVARDASGNFSANVVTANGSAITALNASSISSGTIANARTTASSSNGASTIVSRDASGNFSANIITADGSQITALNASAVSSGTLNPSRLGTTSNAQFGSVGVGTAASGTTGEIRATNNITAYFSSDKRFKENIKDVNDALSKVCAIGIKTFDWTDAYIKAHGGEDGYFIQKSSFGVIAQDVYLVFPEAVRIRDDGSLAVDYEKLAILSFGAIKELVKRIEALENK